MPVQAGAPARVGFAVLPGGGAKKAKRKAGDKDVDMSTSNPTLKEGEEPRQASEIDTSEDEPSSEQKGKKIKSKGEPRPPSIPGEGFSLGSSSSSAVVPAGVRNVNTALQEFKRSLAEGNLTLASMIKPPPERPDAFVDVEAATEFIKLLQAQLDEYNANARQMQVNQAGYIEALREQAEYIETLKAQIANSKKALVVSGTAAAGAQVEKAKAEAIEGRAKDDFERVVVELGAAEAQNREDQKKISQLEVDLATLRTSLIQALKEGLARSDVGFKPPDLKINEDQDPIGYVRAIGAFQRREYDAVRADLDAAEKARDARAKEIERLSSELAAAQTAQRAAENAAIEAQGEARKLREDVNVYERQHKEDLKDRAGLQKQIDDLKENVRRAKEEPKIENDPGGSIATLRQEREAEERKHQEILSQQTAEIAKLKNELVAAEIAKNASVAAARLNAEQAKGAEARLKIVQEDAEGIRAQLREAQARLDAAGLAVGDIKSAPAQPLLLEPPRSVVPFFQQVGIAYKRKYDAAPPKVKAEVEKPVEPDVAPPPVDAAPAAAPAAVVVKAEPPIDRDIRALVAMDIEPPDDPKDRQLIVSVDRAAHDAIWPLVVSASGNYGVASRGANKRFTYVEDHLDIEAMCQDRVWTLAIIDLMQFKPPGGGPVTTIYNPLAPLSKQLHQMYSIAQDGTTELLFVLELMLVFNQMKDIPVAGRDRHLLDLIQAHVRRRRNDTKVSHIFRILDSIRDHLELIDMTAKNAQKAGELLWWTQSPLKNELIGLYTGRGTKEEHKKVLVAHDARLRRMFAENKNTYKVLIVSLAVHDGRFLRVFQELCGVLWNAENFMANLNTVMDQPGGAFLIDIFMAAANTVSFNENFIQDGPGQVAHKQVYDDLGIMTRAVWNQTSDQVWIKLMEHTRQLSTKYISAPGSQNLIAESV
jgi:hypothetical protein